MMITSNSRNVFLQIGATRDGLDPYLDACSGRGMKSVLIETPDYLQWRRELKRRSFDLEIPVERPSDPCQVLTALGELYRSVKLILPGFERYVECAYDATEVKRLLQRCVSTPSRI